MSLGYPDLEALEREYDPKFEKQLEERRSDFLRCFETPAGEKVLAYLYDFCHQGTTVTVPGQPDLSAFRDGKRRVLLEILGYLRMDDEKLYRIARGAR